MRWLPWVSREFLASAEARARAEHENAQNLRHALASAEARYDQERAERIAMDERYNRLGARIVEVSRDAERQAVTVERQHQELMRATDFTKRLREEHTAALEMARQEFARERAERLIEQSTADQKYTALLDRLLTVTTPHIPSVGGMIPYVEKEPQSEGDKEISKVIREQAGDNHALARDLRATARELKRAGQSTDEIVGALVSYWSSESVGQS